MAEYIEREATLKLLRGASIAKYPSTFGVGILAAVKEIVDIPAADVAPVVHGRWKRYGRNLGECSNCGEIVATRHNYCPNCGAKMDGDTC